VPFLSLSFLLFKEMSAFLFFESKFFLLGSGKKRNENKFLFFSLEATRRAAHFGQLNSFFDNSAVLRTGIFLFLLFYFSLRPNHFRSLKSSDTCLL